MCGPGGWKREGSVSERELGWSWGWGWGKGGRTSRGTMTGSEDSIVG